MQVSILTKKLNEKSNIYDYTETKHETTVCTVNTIKISEFKQRSYVDVLRLEVIDEQGRIARFWVDVHLNNRGQPVVKLKKQGNPTDGRADTSKSVTETRIVQH